MKFVDSHIHLSDEEYSERIDDVITDAKNSNVVALVSNSMSLETSMKSLKLAEKYLGIVYAAVGIHPWSINSLIENELQQVVDLIYEHKDNRALIAIGEIGLDYKCTGAWNKQVMIFDEMLHVAEKIGLPVIIHSRGTTSQIVEMLSSYKIKKVLLHWFSNPISLLTKVVEKGYYITEGPPTAYSNGIREIVRRIPLTNLLTETDGPVRYFKQPFNGQIPMPTFILTVVKAIAEIKKLEVSIVAEQIAKNFEDFFGVKLN
ncbi:MAG: TatD family hydrolase [Candidatus Bathycorpusculaceae bacterium]